MKSRTASILSIAIVLIVIVVTLLTFVLIPFEKTTTNYIGLFFLLLSEVLAGIVLLKFSAWDNNTVFKVAGRTSIVFTYFFVTLILFFVSGFFFFIPDLFLLIQILVLAGAAIAYILVTLFAARVQASDQKIRDDRRLMEDVEQNVFDLAAAHKGKPAAANLEALYEEIRYSDKIGQSPADDQLVQTVESLQSLESLDTEEAEKLMEEAKALLAQRNNSVKQSKRGGF